MGKKPKSLTAKLAAQGGATKRQQRTAAWVERYDNLMKKPQPLTRQDSASLRKKPPTGRERKVAALLKHQARAARREVRQADRDNIAALLEATKSIRPAPSEEEEDELQFCGSVEIQSQDEATAAAIEASAAPFDPNHSVLFVSGTSVKKGKGERLEGTTALPWMRSAGAAVVYKTAPGIDSDEERSWEMKSFGLGLSRNDRASLEIEASLRSIAEALSLVAVQMACVNDASPTRPKVTIFTNNRSAMNRIGITRRTAQKLESTPSLEKLITRSEYLRHIGVQVELRWSPRLQSEGSKQAEGASRRAATSHGTSSCKSGDSPDDELQILIDSLEQNGIESTVHSLGQQFGAMTVSHPSTESDLVQADTAMADD